MTFFWCFGAKNLMILGVPAGRHLFVSTELSDLSIGLILLAGSLAVLCTLFAASSQAAQFTP